MYIYIYIYIYFREEKRGFFFFSSPRSKTGNPSPPSERLPLTRPDEPPPATFPGSVPMMAMLPCRW